MFTVVICSSEFLSDVKNNYSHILEALSKEDDCAICVWDTKADTFEDALPNLRDIVVGKGAWRAVVIQDGITFGREYIDRRNPFDEVGAVKVIQDFNEEYIFEKLDEYSAAEQAGFKVDTSAWNELDEKIKEAEERIKAYREIKIGNYKTAVCNPLTRLGLWLFGIAIKQPPRVPEGSLSDLYNDTYAINRDYFLEILDNGVLASEIEQYHILNYKNSVLTANFKTGSMLPNSPESVLVLSERIKSHSEDVFYSTMGEFEEIEYSNFCDDNLYSDRMRFMFFDVNYENDKRSAKDFLAFISGALIFAENEVPEHILRPERVYKSDAIIDDRKIIAFYNRYLTKLYKTRDLLRNMYQKRSRDNEAEDITAQEAIDTFEADVSIPVEISREHDKDELMAEYDKISLAKDCPIEEYDYWYNQVTQITKSFIRYLREPRRALKKSVKSDFRANNAIFSERTINLNEYQTEDIQYHLDEEERNMVETTTPSIFKTKEYTEEIEKADREIRRGISQRMTRKKTVLSGVIAVLAYLFGFFPLLFGNTNTAKSFLFSALVTAIVLAIFLIIGFIYLFVLKRRLVNRFKHFNYVMSGILKDIENGLQAFSRYLSHACNVMREFSVLNWLKKKEDIKLNTLKKHIRDIEAKIKDTEEMFICDYSRSFVADKGVEPYSYDFALLRDYVYEIPYNEVEAEVEFITKGNMVDTNIEYIESIKITREELYD